jgi:hypothetical protein
MVMVVWIAIPVAPKWLGFATVVGSLTTVAIVQWIQGGMREQGED